jgi:hypothetical protein
MPARKVFCTVASWKVDHNFETYCEEHLLLNRID